MDKEIALMLGQNLTQLQMIVKFLKEKGILQRNDIDGKLPIVYHMPIVEGQSYLHVEHSHAHTTITFGYDG